MLQQVMIKPHTIEFHEVDRPQAKNGEVIVKTHRIGICGSDIHVFQGEHPFTTYPVTQGHEISGVIESVGEGVHDLVIGQKVTIQPQQVCGLCFQCVNGKYNLCEQLKVMGFQAPGMASEFFAVDSEKIIPLPSSMTFDDGAMIEPVAVAVHAIRRIANIKGIKIVVIGAGPIGNLVAQVGKGMGAESVLITDISEYRLSVAKDCGIDHIANTRAIDMGDAIQKAFGTDKADVIFDCVANDITMGQAIRYARKGSMIVLVGVYVGMANIDLALLNDHELDLNTSMMYRREDFLDSIKLITEKKVFLSPLQSHHFPFKQYSDAYKYIEENREKSLKILIDIE